jgi:hypothetical protein
LKLGEKHSLRYNIDNAELKRIFGTTVLSEGIIILNLRLGLKTTHPRKIAE